MKTLFIFRDSYDAKYITSKLIVKNINFNLIIETGLIAKKKKLKNYFKKLHLYQYPIGVFNILALLIYSHIYTSKMRKILNDFDYPDGSVSLTVEDANDDKCIDYINNYNPDIIFIYGTAILKRKFLEKVKSKILNIHTGIVPFYRNVHSDFWAFINKDKKNIGISIMYVDAGIDTGDVFLIKRLKIEDTNDLTRIKVKNLELIVETILEILNKVKQNDFIRIKQNNSVANNYNTPSIKDLIKLFLK